MTLKKLFGSMSRLTYVDNPLNYFQYGKPLTIAEIKTLREVFPTYRFSSKVSMSGNVFLSKANEKFVRWSLPLSTVREYMEDKS